MHTLCGVACEYWNTDVSSYLFYIALFFCATENTKGGKLDIMK